MPTSAELQEQIADLPVGAVPQWLLNQINLVDQVPGSVTGQAAANAQASIDQVLTQASALGFGQEADTGISPELQALIDDLFANQSARDEQFAAAFAGQSTALEGFLGSLSTNQMSASASLTPSGAGGSDVATGFPLFERTMEILLQAERARQSSISQQIDLATLFTELERTSPTRAADLATQLGLPGRERDFAFTGLFGQGNQFAPTSGGFISGQVGGSQVSLPQAFGGQELSFLSQNPNVARVIGDVADKFGLPDIFQRSQAGLLPTSTIANLAF